MEGRDRFVDTMLNDELRKLNAHLPKNRKELKDLLREDPPIVPTVDGGKIIMKKSELEELALSLPEEVRGRVKLPLVLLRRTDLGPGAFTVLGDLAEEFALSRIAKGFTGSYDEFRRHGDEQSLFYKPQVSELLRRFHSLFVIGFETSEFKRV